MFLLIRLLAIFLLSCDDSKWFFSEHEHELEAWELLDQNSDLGNNKACEWQKSSVFPYHWLFSGELARNDAYLMQMLVDCIIVRDGKSSCSQAVSTCRWLSGHFISFPTGGTESLARTDNCHLCYCCFEFSHLPDAAVADTHTFKNKLHFLLFLSCHMLPPHFAFHFAIRISFPSPHFFLFLHLSPCVSLLYIVFLFLHSILSSLHFLSFTFCLFFLPLNSLLFFHSIQYVNKTFGHSNIFCSALQASELFL